MISFWQALLALGDLAERGERYRLDALAECIAPLYTLKIEIANFDFQ